MQEKWKRIPASRLGNAMEMIGKDWMLIVARDEQKDGVNAMTASWGCMGVLWNKNIAVCFIRPQRYTYGLVEASDRISLAFPSEAYRQAMTVCGRKSGRDCDKLTEAGLTTEELDGVPVIAEAEYNLICRKLYVDDLKEECFLDRELLSHYQKDYHRIYVCEIESAYQRIAPSH